MSDWFKDFDKLFEYNWLDIDRKPEEWYPRQPEVKESVPKKPKLSAQDIRFLRDSGISL